MYVVLLGILFFKATLVYKFTDNLSKILILFLINFLNKKKLDAKKGEEILNGPLWFRIVYYCKINKM